MAVFSIIVPVYNVEKYLAKCLDSLISQTFTDIEIICINDGSKDRSKQILDMYAARDKRLVVLNQENTGLSAARNAGVRKSNGEYLLFVDSDDAIELNTCEILWKGIQTTQADIIVFGLKDMIKAPVDKWFQKVSSPKKGWFTPFSSWVLLYEDGAYPYACRDCFRRDFLERHNLTFDESVYYVIVDVSDDGKGGLTASKPTITKKGSTEAVDTVEFSNVYTAPADTNDPEKDDKPWIWIAIVVICVLCAVIVFLVYALKKKRV